jgi:hypothetical protein
MCDPVKKLTTFVGEVKEARIFDAANRLNLEASKTSLFSERENLKSIGKAEPGGPNLKSIPRSDLVPPGAPDWITGELLAETIRVWQPDYEKTLTTEDALEILLNVGNLLDILEEIP